MTVDLMLSRSSAFDLTEVQGYTDKGIEFVDAYTALEIEVLDAGHIVIPRDGQEALEIRAREAGLQFGYEAAL